MTAAPRQVAPQPDGHGPSRPAGRSRSPACEPETVKPQQLERPRGARCRAFLRARQAAAAQSPRARATDSPPDQGRGGPLCPLSPEPCLWVWSTRVGDGRHGSGSRRQVGQAEPDLNPSSIALQCQCSASLQQTSHAVARGHIPWLAGHRYSKPALSPSLAATNSSRLCDTAMP